MPRNTNSEVDLSTPTKRARLITKLGASTDIRWTKIGAGIHLGYRNNNPDELGTWYGRQFRGGAVPYVVWKIGPADDRSAEANNDTVFSHNQAVALAMKGKPEESKNSGGYLVSHAIAKYLEYLKTDRRSHDDTKLKLTAYVPKKLMQTPVADLTTEKLDDWRKWTLTFKPAGRKDWAKAMRKAGSADALAAEYDHAVSHFGKTIPPKVLAAYERRTKELQGLVKQRKHGPAPTKPKPQPKVVDADEKIRKKKATVNRVITSLKAALNKAYEDEKVPSDAGWRRLKKFDGVDSPRVRWLRLDEITRLANASDNAWRQVVNAAVQTGCRWAELRKAKVGDYDPTSGKLHIPKSKNGKDRWISLSPEGIAFFESITAGRKHDAPLLVDEAGSAWSRVAQIRKMDAATENAKLVPRATFHTLRHTYASLLVQKGTPLIIVAGAMGHKDTRMVEKTYGHLAPNSIADAIRANLPSFGIAIDTKVTRLRA